MLSPESLVTPTQMARGESRPPSFVDTPEVRHTSPIHRNVYLLAAIRPLSGTSPPSYQTSRKYIYSPHLTANYTYAHSLDSEEGLRKFQRGEIYDDDLEWYRLVPPEAREVLSSSEVQRQSILFEIIKSEKDYVSDLETLQEVGMSSSMRLQLPKL